MTHKRIKSEIQIDMDQAYQKYNLIKSDDNECKCFLITIVVLLIPCYLVILGNMIYMLIKFLRY